MNYFKYKPFFFFVMCIICSFVTTILTHNLFYSNDYNYTNKDEIVEEKLGDSVALFSSDNVGYDNSTSGIQSNNVRGAIDELYACASDFTTYDTRLQGVETKVGSDTLNTTSQNISGAVNELKSGLGGIKGKYSSTEWIEGAQSASFDVKIAEGSAALVFFPGYSDYCSGLVLITRYGNGQIRYANIISPAHWSVVCASDGTVTITGTVGYTAGVPRMLILT